VLLAMVSRSMSATAFGHSAVPMPESVKEEKDSRKEVWATAAHANTTIKL